MRMFLRMNQRKKLLQRFEGHQLIILPDFVSQLAVKSKDDSEEFSE